MDASFTGAATPTREQLVGGGGPISIFSEDGPALQQRSVGKSPLQNVSNLGNQRAIGPSSAKKASARSAVTTTTRAAASCTPGTRQVTTTFSADVSPVPIPGPAEAAEALLNSVLHTRSAAAPVSPENSWATGTSGGGAGDDDDAVDGGADGLDDSRVELITELLARVDLNSSSRRHSSGSTGNAMVSGGGSGAGVETTVSPRLVAAADRADAQLRRVSLEDIIHAVSADISAVAAEMGRQCHEHDGSDDDGDDDGDAHNASRYSLDASASDVSALVMHVGRPYLGNDTTMDSLASSASSRYSNRSGGSGGRSGLNSFRRSRTGGGGVAVCLDSSVDTHGHGDDEEEDPPASFLSDRVEIVESFECPNCSHSSDLTVRANCINGGQFDDQSAEIFVVPRIDAPHSTQKRRATAAASATGPHEVEQALALLSPRPADLDAAAVSAAATSLLTALSPVRRGCSSAAGRATDGTLASSSSPAGDALGRLERRVAHQSEINATLQRLVVSQQVELAHAAARTMAPWRLAGFGVLAGVAGFLTAVLAFVLLCM